MPRNKSAHRFYKIKNLPQLPNTLLKLIEACRREDVTSSELVEIISTDPSLTSKLMEIIGSSYVNLPGDITSVKSAVLYLGINTIKNIAISSSAMQVFKMTGNLDGFNINDFWQHSFKTAVLARKTALETSYGNPDEAFLTGLLHDIGRIALIANFPEAYREIIENHSREEEMIVEETRRFDVTSPEISSWLFSKWRLNPFAADAVYYINSPPETVKDALILVKIIFAANKLADPENLVSIGMISSLIGIPEYRLNEILDDADNEVLDIARNLGIPIRIGDSFSIPADNDDTIKQENDLISKVREYSLFYGTLEALLGAKDRQSVFKIMDNAFKILFGISKTLCFFIDSDKQLLSGDCRSDSKLYNVIRTVAVPTSNASSIITKSFNENKILNSFDINDSGSLAISDQQLTRFLGSQGLFSIPLYARDIPLGIFLLGIDKDDLETLLNSQSLLQLTVSQAAVCLENLQNLDTRDEMLQGERMKAFSLMTRNIIHEINNPVSIIKNYLRILRLKLPDKHPSQPEISVVVEEIDRIAELIETLSEFTEPDIQKFEPVDVNQILTSILAIIQKSLMVPRKIKIEVKTDPDIPLVRTDKNGLKQVFINLLKNAAEAMTEGGNIKISTRFVTGSERYLISEKIKIPGNIEIEISDNGPGIPDHIRQRLFEPYNSSKDGKNRGLGLSIVYRIIRKLNGTITCTSSKESHGSTFTILLPVKSSKNNS